MTPIKVCEITSHNSFASSGKLFDKALIIFSMGVDLGMDNRGMYLQKLRDFNINNPYRYF